MRPSSLKSLVVPLAFCAAVSTFGAVPRLPEGALKLPFVYQATDYSCGAAALLSVLAYWGAYEGHELDLYKKVGTTEDNGTEPGGLARGARSYGLEASVRRNLDLEDLRLALLMGYTPILDIQAWRGDDLKSVPWRDIWTEGHYVALIAMDSEYTYFMDPSSFGSYAYIPVFELMDRWHDVYDNRHHAQRYSGLAVMIRGNLSSRPDRSGLARIE